MFRRVSVIISAATILFLMHVRPASSADIQSRVDHGVVEIAIVGDLKVEDGEKFAQLTGTAPHGVVLFNSNGGLLIAGLRIGEIIRERQFVTVVPDGATCASACAIAWLGGSIRFLGHHSLLGFHAAYDANGAQIGAGNAVLGAYLAHLGLSYSAIASVTAAGPSEMNWLDVEEAKKIGIDARELPKTRKFNPPDVPTTNTVRTDRGEAPLERRAAQFLLEYFARGSDSADRATAFDEGIYAETLNYYGSIRTKHEVLADKAAYLHRWPERLYIPQGNTISVECDHSRGTCKVAGNITYECRSHTRQAYSAGTSRFSLTISFAPSGIHIIGEDGRVIRRL